MRCGNSVVGVASSFAFSVIHAPAVLMVQTDVSTFMTGAGTYTRSSADLKSSVGLLEITAIIGPSPGVH